MFGENYANDVDSRRRDRSSIEPGAWRLELTPQKAAQEDHFLTVMQVSDHPSPARWPVKRLEATNRIGCQIEGPESNWIVLLHPDTRRTSDAVEFTVAGSEPCRVLVTDLAPGKWTVSRTGAPSARDSGSRRVGDRLAGVLPGQLDPGVHTIARAETSHSM